MNAAPPNPSPPPPSSGHHLATISHEGRFWDVYLEFEDDPRRPTSFRALLCFFLGLAFRLLQLLLHPFLCFLLFPLGLFLFPFSFTLCFVLLLFGLSVCLFLFLLLLNKSHNQDL